jgi:hypothetical protein
VLEIASWISAQTAGTFLGQHAILVFSLVLASLFAACLSLRCLLYKPESRVWPFALADIHYLQNPAILSTSRDRFPGVFARVVYRLSLDGHLGAFSTFSLFVLTVTGAGFLVLALEIGQQDWLVRFDHSLCASLYEHSTVNAVRIFQLVSLFGDAWTLASISVLLAIALVVTRCWRLLFLWTISLPGTGILNQF